jgi:hypothetical protein
MAHDGIAIDVSLIASNILWYSALNIAVLAVRNPKIDRCLMPQSRHYGCTAKIEAQSTRIRDEERRE